MYLMPESKRFPLYNFKVGLVDALMLPPKAVVQGSMASQLQEVERRSDNSDMDEGAQPLPELQTPPGQGVLDTETRRLIGRFLRDFTGLSTAAWIQSKAQSTMKRVVTRLVDKHRILFNRSMASQLQEVERRSDNSDMDEGAQPLPELQTPPGQGVLDTETRRLIGRFLRDFTGLSTAAWIQSKAQSTMKRVVTRLVDKHRILFNNMVNELSLDQRGLDRSFVSQVAQTEFANGNINWGRIASLLAFCAVLSQALKENQQERCVELVAQEVSTYLLSHQRTWLVQHNGWDGFAEFFKEDDLESTVRNGLFAFVGLVSVTAALRCLIR
ncbi:induced myeloid leukemia cell differentiation protein Mcl-1-like [Hippocampus comes]|uniref:induced myeloid leukemia cell differentiation protein Mcl-1-like n=1 Tax=Hippocampus comes TaxID=109280 RepID=UPI00094EED08|nr:PREDICTED: induced myeloid leukemia cell differentiation protein Mcl-1-like [Hippocampus comes]